MVRATLGGTLSNPFWVRAMAEKMNGSDEELDLDPRQARAQTGDLADRIRSMNRSRSGSAAAQEMRQKEMTGMGRGFRLASEFVSAIFIGSLIGWVIDQLLGTLPIFMVVFMMLGFAAGVRNVIRSAAEMNKNAPQPDPKTLAPIDGDEEDD